jgi:hypothetical protein
MVWQKICMTMLAGAMASMLALPLRGDDLKKEDPKEQVPAPKGDGSTGGDCCGQQYRTVSCYEWVPETHMVKKTCYRHECRDVCCTVNKTELVPETRTRCVTCRRLVPECHDVVCCERVCVPCTEERTCIEHRVTCKDVCTTTRRMVDRGHWECCEEISLRGRMQRGFDGFRRHHGDCCNSCCNSCGNGCGNDCCENHCYPTRTVRHWVSCKVCEECPCHHTVRCVECVPVKKCVTSYHYETRQVCKKVTCYKCVCETKNVCYTCLVPHCVQCQVTHKVSVCVPYCVEVPVCCYVKRCVQKQVPCCETRCCRPSCCETSCCEPWHRRLLRGLRGNNCCEHSCGGCGSCCN